MAAAVINMPLHFRNFQTRLLVLFLAPLLIVLAAVYYAVSTASINNAFSLITTDLEQSAYTFETAIENRTATLAASGDALSSDFAFKQTFSTSDAATILSAMENLLSRLSEADFIAFTRYKDNTVVANTLVPEQANELAPWLSLIEQANAKDRIGEFPEASDVQILEGRPYHTMVLPLLTPDLENWVTLGFEINQQIINEFGESVSAELTVLFKDKDQWHINASTLDKGSHAELMSAFNNMMNDGLNDVIRLSGKDYVSLASPLSVDGNVEILLQRSLAEELKPFYELRRLLLQIFAVGVFFIFAGVILISRNVTRPVRLLAQGARRIAEGDYAQRVDLRQLDEIGELSKAFNQMATGLAEKEKVRDLLGKVVSPEIANELMSKEINLGGTEQEVTILFADVRGFTELCEGQSPEQILSLLNEYFSAITTVIEAQGGVVDKYIGDAVMALFGAPIQNTNAATNAISASLLMFKELDLLNQHFQSRGLGAINIGIGINTDKVVVGNMGSKTRLNYTAIGDGVNLASRLESLTKQYGVKIIVSEQSCLQAPEIAYIELDKVRVSGKQEPVRIFSPLIQKSEADEDCLQAIAIFQTFLNAYYEAEFTQAQTLLEQYADTNKSLPGLVALYRARLQLLIEHPPTQWSGVHTYTDK